MCHVPRLPSTHLQFKQVAEGALVPPPVVHGGVGARAAAHARHAGAAQVLPAAHVAEPDARHFRRRAVGSSPCRRSVLCCSPHPSSALACLPLLLLLLLRVL
jgi:hypothetical protein